MSPIAPQAPWYILASRFHGVVVDRLVEGAEACLASKGLKAPDVRVLRVAGAFELPQLASAVVSGGGAPEPAGVVVLGCVVRGETPHFDYVCQEVSRGVMHVALRSGCPLGFGLLTCDTLEQALARAGGEHGDKGWEAAEAAWDLAATIRALRRDAT